MLQVEQASEIDQDPRIQTIYSWIPIEQRLDALSEGTAQQQARSLYEAGYNWLEISSVTGLRRSEVRMLTHQVTPDPTVREMRRILDNNRVDSLEPKLRPIHLDQAMLFVRYALAGAWPSELQERFGGSYVTHWLRALRNHGFPIGYVPAKIRGQLEERNKSKLPLEIIPTGHGNWQVRVGGGVVIPISNYEKVILNLYKSGRSVPEYVVNTALHEAGLARSRKPAILIYDLGDKFVRREIPEPIERTGIPNQLCNWVLSPWVESVVEQPSSKLQLLPSDQEGVDDLTLRKVQDGIACQVRGVRFILPDTQADLLNVVRRSGERTLRSRDFHIRYKQLQPEYRFDKAMEFLLEKFARRHLPPPFVVEGPANALQWIVADWVNEIRFEGSLGSR